MGKTTLIEWTNASWNPWQGCRKVSPGCKYCYMYRAKERYGQDPTVVRRSKTTFTAPLTWTPPRVPWRVFTCSWSDFVIEEADAWRDEAWDVIRRTPHLTYQVLTKRPERLAGRLPWTTDPWPHVWLGVSVETLLRPDHDAPRDPERALIPFARTSARPTPGPPARRDWLGHHRRGERPGGLAPAGGSVGARPARPMPEGGGPVFVKQLGTSWARAHGGEAKGGNWTRWPADLRAREFPAL
jgi:Protein of unknown function (DUF5131)